MEARLNSVHIPGIIKVIGANIAAVGITLTEVTDWLKFVSVCVALGYSIWKWISDIKAKKNDS